MKMNDNEIARTLDLLAGTPAATTHAPAGCWRYLTDLSRDEKRDFAVHRDFAQRLTLWWEDHAYFKDIGRRWNEPFQFGEYDSFQQQWLTKHHRRVRYVATTKNGQVVRVREKLEARLVANAIVGAAQVTTQHVAGKARQAYALMPPIAYPNWPQDEVWFLHLDLDYHHLKQLWREQDRPDELRVDAHRHPGAAADLLAVGHDRQVLGGLGALVVASHTGLHAHWYLAEPLPPDPARQLILAIDRAVQGQVEQTNLGALRNWNHRQPHLPLPLPRQRRAEEFMRVPQELLDFFVVPGSWTIRDEVRVDPGELERLVVGGTRAAPACLRPAVPHAGAGAEAPAALGPGMSDMVVDKRKRPQDLLLGQIQDLLEPYLREAAAGGGAFPSLVSGQLSPAVPNIPPGDSQAWFRAGHIHRFATWSAAKQFVLEQSKDLDSQTQLDRLAVANWMWQRGAGQLSDGLATALTPALLQRVAAEVVERLQPSGNRRGNRLHAKRLRLGVGLLSSLLDARKRTNQRFYKTFSDLAKSFGESDSSNFGNRILKPFFEPFFHRVDWGDIPEQPRQQRPCAIYEPTPVGHELLALAPPHPSPQPLHYTSVPARLPLARRRRTSRRANAWLALLPVDRGGDPEAPADTVVAGSGQHGKIHFRGS